jgi:hypothetical protein
MAGQEQHDNGLGQAERPQEEVDEELEEKFTDLDFAAHKSVRYHEKLASFFARWRDRFRVITVVAGSGAFVIVLAGWQHLSEWLTGFVGLWAILDLVIRPDKMHDLHSELRGRFIGLAIKLQQTHRTQASLAELTTQRLEIEHDEPACKRLVDLEARNDEIRAREWPLDQLAPLSAAQRRWGCYVTFGLRRLEDWKAGIVPAPHRWRHRIGRVFYAVGLFGLGACSAYVVFLHRDWVEVILGYLRLGHQ